MLSEEVIDKVVERLVSRIEDANLYVLKEIAKNIKKIGTLTPTNAMQLGQIIKYGGSYEKILKKLADITNLNVRDIQKIFEEVAKQDYAFAKQFYVFRNKDYLPYEKTWLKTQVDALAEMTMRDYVNLVNTNAIGFSFENINGVKTFKSLLNTYEEIIDTVILSVAQGKSTFQQEMFRTLKNLGGSGLKRVEYESGRSVRLDSVVRMHLKDSIRNLHNETQKIIGNDIDFDGWEISVHEYPAPDHELVQGKQFSIEEFDNFQNDRRATSYDKVVFEPEFEGHDRRSIGQYNCYHVAFSIILGVNEPQYTNKQLKEIINRNNEGFDFENKHYTMYEGTQLQRQIETAIRKQKDLQIMGREAGESGREQVEISQKKISALAKRYKNLCDASGLPAKIDRLRVSGYKKVKTTLQ